MLKSRSCSGPTGQPGCQVRPSWAASTADTEELKAGTVSDGAVGRVVVAGAEVGGAVVASGATVLGGPVVLEARAEPRRPAEDEQALNRLAATKARDRAERARR